MSHRLDCYQTCKHLGEGASKSLLYFCDSDLIFKVKSQATESDVKFPLKMRYFFYQMMDIHQTCMDLSL